MALLISALGRRILVVAFDVFAMMARSKPARVTG
jgi:hypothetical protein